MDLAHFLAKKLLAMPALVAATAMAVSGLTIQHVTSPFWVPVATAAMAPSQSMQGIYPLGRDSQHASMSGTPWNVEVIAALRDCCCDLVLWKATQAAVRTHKATCAQRRTCCNACSADKAVVQHQHTAMQSDLSTFFCKGAPQNVFRGCSNVFVQNSASSFCLSDENYSMPVISELLTSQ